MQRLALAVLASTLAFAPVAAQAEFLAPTFETLAIDGVTAPDWIAGVREGKYIGMCANCPGGVMLLEVSVINDDGTGARIKSGETTPDDMTEIGKANAASLGNGAEYYSTERFDFGDAVGLRTQAKAATGDFTTRYHVYGDDKVLVIRAVGKEQAAVDSLAEKIYNAAAPLTFR